MKTLILGGVKSGKSRQAETLAIQSGLPVIYIATATAEDEAMRLRIDQHRAQRPTSWTTIEEPLALARTVREQAAEHRCILIDCLTLWVTNLLCKADGTTFQRERDAFLEAVTMAPGLLLSVSNETNLGIVPQGELARRFCDEIGLLHQALAARCDRVIFMVAGLPWYVKGSQ